MTQIIWLLLPTPWNHCSLAPVCSSDAPNLSPHRASALAIPPPGTHTPAPHIALVGSFPSFESWLQDGLSGPGLTLLSVGSLAETVLSSSPGTASYWLWGPEQLSGPWLPHL